MQNRYVADIGDFGKFQLFRFLFNAPSPLADNTLAQIWFLHENEESNNDGRHINYFERVKGSDVPLEAIMIELLKEDRRYVKELEKVKVLDNVNFYYPHIPENYHDRKVWLEEALHFSKESQVVAVAPDNGMALKCHREEKSFSLLNYHDRKSTPHKYIFDNEIDAFYNVENRKITIVYQHLGRCFSHDKQIEALLELLKSRYTHIIAIKHKPYSPRVFFFLCKNERVLEVLQNRLEDFAKQHSAFWKVYRANG